ncbi:MAG TPA: hypothetical protein VNA89_15680 [Gemmatimonadaceae bacterium]|nr:hypothetical protein [Gemmatimonadaceae bacterium]
MMAIILEGALFVAALATVGALIFQLFVRKTPAGLRMRQNRNRELIDRAAALRCPIHGELQPEALVRLRTGEQVCPECYKEIVHGDPHG